jgi:hypothetical protein
VIVITIVVLRGRYPLGDKIGIFELVVRPLFAIGLYVTMMGLNGGIWSKAIVDSFQPGAFIGGAIGLGLGGFMALMVTTGPTFEGRRHRWITASSLLWLFAGYPAAAGLIVWVVRELIT